MNLDIMDTFDERARQMRSIKTSTLTCPHCRDVIKFVVDEYGQDFDSMRQELEHYKKLSSSLMKDNFDLRGMCRRLAQQ